MCSYTFIRVPGALWHKQVKFKFQCTALWRKYLILASPNRFMLLLIDALLEWSNSNPKPTELKSRFFLVYSVVTGAQC